jgi:hypothetical protein
MPIRRLLATLAAAAVLSIVLLVIPAYGDRSDPTELQTWPSRTPTSDTNPPTDGGEPPDTDGGGDSGESVSPPPPTPPSSDPEQKGTATAVIATSLATIPAVVRTQLPAGALLATAEPCGLPPTALAAEAVTVRQGPGNDFEIVGRMNLLAVRPVIGRAARTPWWLVALEDGQAGWVPDRAVVIHGHAGAVDVLEALAVAGRSPDPLQVWSPTPNPLCPTPIPVASGGNEVVAAQTEAAGDGADAIGREDTGEESSALASGLSGNSAGDASVSGESLSDPGASLPAGSLEHSDGSLTWLLLIGIALIIGGAIAILLQVRGSRSGSSS